MGNTIIGIDPGTHTGLAVWNGSTFTEVTSLPLHAALLRVRDLRDRRRACSPARRRGRVFRHQKHKGQMKTYYIKIVADEHYQKVEVSGNTPALLEDAIKDTVKQFYKQ